MMTFLKLVLNIIAILAIQHSNCVFSISVHSFPQVYRNPQSLVDCVREALIELRECLNSNGVELDEKRRKAFQAINALRDANVDKDVITELRLHAEGDTFSADKLVEQLNVVLGDIDPLVSAEK